MAVSRKIRADVALVERRLAESRTRAQALIMAGAVYSGEQRISKAGDMVARDVALEVREKDHPWASRGGVKLAHGLDAFAISATGCVVLDIGASTGGFTDVALTGGAAKVYAVDVGHGQLAWKLRNDDRVIVLERINARYLTSDEVPEPVNLILCDASFISLTTILPAGLALAAPGADLVALIKPQFEVGRGKVGKGGIVRDPALHRQVCDKISDWLDGRQGWRVLGLTESPIKGPGGNVEFLIAAHFDG